MKNYTVVFNDGTKWTVKGYTPNDVMKRYSLQRNTIKTLSPTN